MMVFDSFQTRQFDSGNSLWDALSPSKKLGRSPYEPVFRGQANADWKLIPTILRCKSRRLLRKLMKTQLHSDDQVWVEGYILDTFIEFCDSTGIVIPNDSLACRESLSIRDQFYLEPEKWPSNDFIEIMALAQHHGIPTRLLDWTTNPYAAIYFAASSALSSIQTGKQYDHLAVWVLNTESLNLYPRVRVVRPPGSISRHIAAQSGLFSVHPHDGLRGQSFEVAGLENEFSILPDTPLTKLTVPFQECFRLMELCNKIGFSAATMYPSADGVGKGVMESLNLWAHRSQ